MAARKKTKKPARRPSSKITSPWETVLKGESSYGPNNNVDIELEAAHNEASTVWVLRKTIIVDPLEGFRCADDDEPEDLEERIEDVATLQVPTGTDPHAAVRALLAKWKAEDPGGMPEFLTDTGAYELEEPGSADF
jgi:hypothetical protein